MQKHTSQRAYTQFSYALEDLATISANVQKDTIRITLQATMSSDAYRFPDSATFVLIREEWDRIRRYKGGYAVDGFRFIRFYTDAVDIFSIGGSEQSSWAVPLEMIETAVRGAERQHRYLERQKKRGAKTRWGDPIDTGADHKIHNSFRHLAFWTPSAEAIFQEDAWTIYQDNPGCHEHVLDRVEATLRRSRSQKDICKVYFSPERPTSLGFRMVSGTGDTILVGGIIQHGPDNYSVHT